MEKTRTRVSHDAMDLAEARYELVISVDARRSGEYDDVDKQRMRERIYRVLEAAFTHAKVARDAVHMEDRGDGVLLSVAGRIAVTRLLGLWMVEVAILGREPRVSASGFGWACTSGLSGTTAGASAGARSTSPAGWPTRRLPDGCWTPSGPTSCW